MFYSFEIKSFEYVVEGGGGPILILIYVSDPFQSYIIV